MGIVAHTLQELIGHLDANGIEYYFIRNYEHYPTTITGDIDLYCDLPTLRRTQDDLIKIFGRLGWRIFYHIDRPWVLVFQLVNPEHHEDRNILVIECFNLFTWISFEYLDATKVKEYQSLYNGFTVVPRDIGYFITLCHYFFWAGFFPLKYRLALRESLTTRTTESLFGAVFRGKVGRRFLQDLCASLDDDGAHWQEVRNIPEKIFKFAKRDLFFFRAQIALRNIGKKPLSTLIKTAKATAILLKELSTLRGNIILTDHSNADAEHLLLAMKQYHIFKNKNSGVDTIIETTNRLFLLGYCVTIYSRIFRGNYLILRGTSIQIRFLKKIFGRKAIVWKHTNNDIDLTKLLLEWSGP